MLILQSIMDQAWGETMVPAHTLWERGALWELRGATHWVSLLDMQGSIKSLNQSPDS